MKMIINESANKNENVENLKLDKSESFEEIEEVKSVSLKSEKTVKKDNFSGMTEIQKVKVLNTEKIQDAKNLIENLKTTSNLLTPENIPKINLLSLNGNKNSIHVDSHFYIKESIIRQNSNFLSDNQSFIQDKENIFGNGDGCVNVNKNRDHKTKNRFSHCNYDSVNREQIYDLKNFEVMEENSLINSQNFKKKKSSPIPEEKKEFRNSMEKSFNLNTRNKAIVKSAKIPNKIKPIIVSALNNDSKFSLENEKVAIVSARGPNENKMKKIIPKKSIPIRSPKRNTNKSENSKISSSRKEKAENLLHVQKVKEFENIIKKTKLNQNSQTLVRNNTSTTNEFYSNQNLKKFELNDEYNTNQLPNQISINKYKFIFSDVDANLNSKNHNYSQGHKHYNSYFKEKEELKNFIVEKVKEISENQNQNLRSSFMANKIANFSNILN